MTNTTEEFWSIDGESLQTYAKNIKTWGGSLQGRPHLRGEDIVIPGRPGRVWVPKVTDSMTRTFAGWVIGADDEGYIGDVQTFRENWRHLERLLWTPRRQVAVGKRWRDGLTVRTAVGYGQVLNGITPEMSGPRRATWSVDVFMADPYFYGPQVSQHFAVLGGSSVTTRLAVPGDDQTTALQVKFTGPLTDAVLQVGDQWVGHTTLAAGVVAIIDVQEFTDIEAGTPVLGKVTHGPGAPWLHLDPGSNDVTFTRSAGSGTADLLYKPVYL